MPSPLVCVCFPLLTRPLSPNLLFSLSVSISFSLCFSLSSPLFLSLSASLFLSLFLSLSSPLFLSIFLSLPLSFSLSLSLFLSLPLSFSLFPSLHLSLSLSLFPSLSLSSNIHIYFDKGANIELGVALGTNTNKQLIVLPSYDCHGNMKCRANLGLLITFSFLVGIFCALQYDFRQYEFLNAFLSSNNNHVYT